MQQTMALAALALLALFLSGACSQKVLSGQEVTDGEDPWSPECGAEGLSDLSADAGRREAVTEDQLRDLPFLELTEGKYDEANKDWQEVPDSAVDGTCFGCDLDTDECIAGDAADVFVDTAGHDSISADATSGEEIEDSDDTSEDGNICKPECTAWLCGVPDGCGGICVSDVACQDEDPCTVDEHCLSEGCVWEVLPGCQAETCNSADDDLDGEVDEGELCPPGELCLDGLCVCLPYCPEGYCGENGCGGVCQACPPGTVCHMQGCCLPDCVGKECGDDGCGGVCGQCPDNCCEPCSADGICEPFVCVPQCEGKECGPTSCTYCPWEGLECTGSCGECPEGLACSKDGLCGALPPALRFASPTESVVGLQLEGGGTPLTVAWTIEGDSVLLGQAPSVTCYLDGVPSGSVAGYQYTFTAIPSGMHKVVCVWNLEVAVDESCLLADEILVMVKYPCAVHDDCASTNPCAIGVCIDVSGGKKECRWTQKSACCLSNFDCGCHEWGWSLCETSNHKCIGCHWNEMCDDANTCTTDWCSSDGICQHEWLVCQ